MRTIPTLVLLGFTLALRAQEPARPAGDWQVRGGLMALVVPRYVGSDETRVVAFPNVSALWRDRLSLGVSRVALGIGADWRLARRGPWTWEVGLALEERRPERRAEGLAGMGDRDVSAWAGMGGGFRAAGWTGGIALSRGLKGGMGTRASLNLGREVRLGGGWAAGASWTALASDAVHQRYELGVDPLQAARRRALLAAGDPRLRPGEDRVFQPGAGLRELRLGVHVTRALPAGWTLSLLGFGSELQGVVRDSPLVRRPRAFGAGVSLMRRF